MLNNWSQNSYLTHWRRPLRGWEIQKERQLPSILMNIKLSTKPDRVRWRVGQLQYTLALGYNMLQRTINPSPFWALFWNQPIPPKIKIFLWYSMYKALPKLDFLKKRRIVAYNLCKWCRNGEEDMQHWLWSCTLSKIGWDLILNWFDLKWSSPPFDSLQAPIAFFSKLVTSWGGSTCRITMNWTMWLTRNECVFNNIFVPKNYRTSSQNKSVGVEQGKWSNFS